jgi:cytochrome c-type biogenesis protein CcmE
MTTPRQRRMWMVIGIVGGVAAAAGLTLKASKSGIGFRSPTEVVEGHVEPGKRFQIGGMVEAGSVQREPGSLHVQFVVTDYSHQVPVVYDRVLPDLFKEDSGVWANGRMNENGVFVADEVIAKHDENYMPPAVGKALEKGQSRLDAQQPATHP